MSAARTTFFAGLLALGAVAGLSTMEAGDEPDMDMRPRYARCGLDGRKVRMFVPYVTSADPEEDGAVIVDPYRKGAKCRVALLLNDGVSPQEKSRDRCSCAAVASRQGRTIWDCVCKSGTCLKACNHPGYMGSTKAQLLSEENPLAARRAMLKCEAGGQVYPYDHANCAGEKVFFNHRWLGGWYYAD